MAADRPLRDDDPAATSDAADAFATADPVPADAFATADPVPADPNASINFFGLASRPMAPTNGLLVDGYEILAELGHGGMGVVYKARHLSLNRTVALKLFRTVSVRSPGALTRFRREGKLIAGLRHPNIVQVYDIGEQDGRPYIELEYVEGGSLDHRLRGAPWPPRQAARLVEVLARAIEEAHRQGIAHCDLKPANVLLDVAGEPKITDFGLSKQLEGGPSHTKGDMIMGTPCYMAPEQARGQTREIGPLADVYALGGILYEMLTGQPPFTGTTVGEIIRKVKEEEPVPPSRLRSKVSRDLEAICLKCLAKEPDRRYASAAELAEDLRRFLIIKSTDPGAPDGLG
jgi:serine/threonine protein kinase